MIDVKKAVAAAVKAARSYYSGKGLRGLSLEEVQLTEDGRNWLITLGFLVPEIRADNPISFLLPKKQKRYERKYKLFTVDRDTGEVLSMRIRQV